MDWAGRGGSPGHLCCYVWCLGGGWLEGIAQLAPFSLHEVPGLTMWSVQQAVRLLSWWLKTLRRSVPRNPGKSSEASEELTFKALGCPFCHILLSGRSLGQSRVKKRGMRTCFSMEASFNWLQMFSNHMAFHMGAWSLGASLFLWEAINMSLYCQLSWPLRFLCCSSFLELGLQRKESTLLRVVVPGFQASTCRRKQKGSWWVGYGNRKGGTHSWKS